MRCQVDVDIPEGFEPVPMAPPPIPLPEVERPPIARLQPVAIVVPSMLMGGAERQAAELAAGLSALGHPVRLIDLMMMPAAALDEEVAIWWGRALEGRSKPRCSVYVAHSPASGVPEDMADMAPLIDVVVGVSRGATAAAMALGLDATTIPNGAAPTGAERPRRGKGLVVGMLTRYEPEKGLAVALEALALCPPSIRLRAHGAGSLAAEMLAAAQRLGCAHRLDLGGVIDPGRLLGEVDALLLPGDHEGLPMAAVEAAHAGVPLVHCGQGALQDHFPPGRALVCERTGPAIAAALERLLMDPPMAMNLGDAARDYAATRLTRDAMARRYSNLITTWRLDLRQEVTCFVITSGETCEAECLRRLEVQTVRPRVEVIRNVAPMDRAFQAMLDRCETPYYIQVDADMMLEPDAVERLYKGIVEAGEDCAEVVGYLWGDAEEQSIQGVKIYRHTATVQAPYTGALSCEWSPMARLRELGYKVVVQERPADRAGCLGLHASMHSSAAAFRRGKRLMQKLKAAPGSMQFFSFMPGHIHGKLAGLLGGRDHRLLAYYRGLIAGLLGPMPEDQEMDANRIDPDLRRLNFWLGAAADGPQEATFYLTDRCNQACPWCRRTIHGPDGGDMGAPIVARVLDFYPTIRAVCLAGFGEPTLHPEVLDVIRTLRDAGKVANMVTNGTTLKRMARDLVAAGLHEVTVSLNGHDRASHAAACGVDNWPTILDGIFEARRAGLPLRVSSVVTRSTMPDVPKFLDLVEELQVQAHVHNLLPHGGPGDTWFEGEVLRTGDAEAVEALKEHPAARLVRTWPVLLGEPGDCPRRCESPFVSVGVDARGMTTPCRRVLAPGEVGGQMHRNLWHSPPWAEYRGAMLGDRDLPDHCQRCFGAWKE